VKDQMMRESTSPVPAAAAAVEFVVAVSEDDVIGRENRLPWRLPADLRRFKALTLGKNVLMGRKTFDSIGKALPGRRNLVLTRADRIDAPDCLRVSSVQEALAAIAPDPNLMVIGGSDVYRLCLPFARRIHLTLVHTRIADGDTHFDAWRGAQWRESARERHEPDEKHSVAYSFITLERR
jgi:dihydrofolate reductase